MSHIIFDIETGPLDVEALKRNMPEFEAPGNLKDPEKIKAAIEKKKEAWLADAALSAETGKILAIGYLEEGVQAQINIDTESELLHQFWEVFGMYSTDHFWVGHNILGFDWPFIVRRSWANGIEVPDKVFKITKYKHHPLIDTMELWSMFNSQDRISLDRLAKFLGAGEKNGSGADFAKLLETDKEKAIAYLKNDLELTEKVYLRLCPSMAPVLEDCPL